MHAHGGTYQGQGLRLGVRLDQAHGAGRAVQQAVDVLHDAQAPHQVVALEESADALQLLLLQDVHGYPGVQRLLTVGSVLQIRHVRPVITTVMGENKQTNKQTKTRRKVGVEVGRGVGGRGTETPLF